MRRASQCHRKGQGLYFCKLSYLMLMNNICRVGPLAGKGGCAFRDCLFQHVQGDVHSRLRGELDTGHLYFLKNICVLWCGFGKKKKTLTYLNAKLEFIRSLLLGSFFCEIRHWNWVLLSRGGVIFVFLFCCHFASCPQLTSAKLGNSVTSFQSPPGCRKSVTCRYERLWICWRVLC